MPVAPTSDIVHLTPSPHPTPKANVPACETSKVMINMLTTAPFTQAILTNMTIPSMPEISPGPVNPSPPQITPIGTILAPSSRSNNKHSPSNESITASSSESPQPAEHL